MCIYTKGKAFKCEKWCNKPIGILHSNERKPKKKRRKKTKRSNNDGDDDSDIFNVYIAVCVCVLCAGDGTATIKYTTAAHEWYIHMDFFYRNGLWWWRRKKTREKRLVPEYLCVPPMKNSNLEDWLFIRFFIHPTPLIHLSLSLSACLHSFARSIVSNSFLMYNIFVNLGWFVGNRHVLDMFQVACIESCGVCARGKVGEWTTFIQSCIIHRIHIHIHHFHYFGF